MEQQPTENPRSARSLVKRSWESVIRGQFGCFALAFLAAFMILWGIGSPSPHSAVTRPVARPHFSTLSTRPMTLLDAGRDAFSRNRCNSCHALQDPPPVPDYGISGTDPSLFAPDLTHEARRHASIVWQRYNLVHHKLLFPDAIMENYDTLSLHDLKALSAYMASRQ